MTIPPPLLEIDDLRVSFGTGEGMIHAVEGISFVVQEGQTLGLVGESGSGKSMTALSAMRLLPDAACAVGAVRYRGINLMRLTDRCMRQFRGQRIAMVFQDPMSSLNPVMSIGSQIVEAIVPRPGSRAEATGRAVELLRLVNIPWPERRVNEYPHQLSGGMRQRVLLAMALASGPDVLIADEPTSALDVLTQAQILHEMKQLQHSRNMGVLLITHDLSVVARSCDRVVVMYAGRKVEEADVEDLLERPLHPYTRALIDATPSLSVHRERLGNLAGEVPTLRARVGCSFAPRCAHADARCRSATPALVRFSTTDAPGATREVACFAVEEGRIVSAYSGAA